MGITAPMYVLPSSVILSQISVPGGGTLELYATHNGVGNEIVGRLVSAVAPYFEITQSGLFVPRGAPSTPLEGMVYYDSATHKLKVRGAAAWEVVTSV